MRSGIVSEEVLSIITAQRSVDMVGGPTTWCVSLGFHCRVLHTCQKVDSLIG